VREGGKSLGSNGGHLGHGQQFRVNVSRKEILIKKNISGKNTPREGSGGRTGKADTQLLD